MKTYYNNKLKRSSKTLLSGHSLYESIEDLPIILWFKINKTNNYKLLIKEGKATEKECQERWEKLMDEYIGSVGINDGFKELIEAKKNLAIALIDYHTTGDEFYLNFVEIHGEEVRILESKTKEKEGDYYDLIVSVERALNVQINENLCSTKKFFTYLKQANEQAERMELKFGKNGNNT